MGNVNSDSQELLNLQNSIKNTISSISTTKARLRTKYDHLGSGWNDNKYRELGNIVQECNTAMNSVEKTLQDTQKFLAQLVKYLQKYENTPLSVSTSQGSYESVDDSSSFGANSFNENLNIHDALKNVEYLSIEKSVHSRSEEEIIDNISGGDRTDGSCSSLAFAYAGNRAGYVVRDFRGGRSREVFSSRFQVEQIANFEGVSSRIMRGTDDVTCANELMLTMERGREYYLATGSHAAVVRRTPEGNLQYLELQNGTPSENGWHILTDIQLYERFHCQNGQPRSNFLIDLESLQNNAEFLNLLGYINTEESSQMRGEDGHVK